MKLTGRDLQKTRLGLLPSPHTKFQFPSSISWRDRRGTAFFSTPKKREGPRIFPPTKGLIFGYVMHRWIFYRMAQNETNFGLSEF